MRDALLKEFCGPAQCYRLRDSDGHYNLRSIDEPVDSDGPLTSTVIHGRDSTLPGVAAFGIPLSDLSICDCGKWEPPTKEQIEITGIKLSIAAAKMRGNSNLS